MVRTDKPETKSWRVLISQNIKAYNKYQTDEYLFALTPLSLCRLSHPIDRMSFAYQAQRLGLITLAEYNEVIKIRKDEKQGRFVGFKRTNSRR